MTGELIALNSMVSRADNLVSNELAGETVMMSIENGEYYALDAVATHVWELIESPRRVEDVCEALCSRYEGAREQIRSDVLSFLTGLAARNLIVVA